MLDWGRGRWWACAPGVLREAAPLATRLIVSTVLPGHFLGKPGAAEGTVVDRGGAAGSATAGSGAAIKRCIACLVPQVPLQPAGQEQGVAPGLLPGESGLEQHSLAQPVQLLSWGGHAPLSVQPSHIPPYMYVLYSGELPPLARLRFRPAMLEACCSAPTALARPALTAGATRGS